ncbi:MAG: exopolysaccharide biosynthesis protein [Rhizomicrobium sp.]
MTQISIRQAATGRMPASVLIEGVVRGGTDEIVTVEWLLKQSPVAARETLMLVLALTALVPGASLPAGLILILLAVPMLFAREGVWLPRYVAARPISLPRLVRLVERVLPVLRWQERMIHPVAQRLVGLSRPLGALLIVALAATLLVPLPFSNVPPALAIAMIAVSYLETSGILLALAAVSGVASLAVTGSTVWAAVGAARIALG